MTADKLQRDLNYTAGKSWKDSSAQVHPSDQNIVIHEILENMHSEYVQSMLIAARLGASVYEKTK